MARMEMHRQAHADPAGVALLLSGPLATELWPGARFQPPLRSGLGFVVELTVDDLEGQLASGHVGIVRTAGEPGATDLRLVLVARAGQVALLRPEAEAFLDGLAAAAQARSSAA